MNQEKTILIIEDNTNIRENIVEILDLAGYKTVDCENGKIGLDLIQKQIPDLILCDIMMPEMDGFTLLHLLRKAEATKAVPFIFLTAKTERFDFRKGMEMGADDFITKPFEELELLNAVESRLLRSESLKQVLKISKTMGNIDIHQIFTSLGKTEKLSKKQIVYEDGKHAKNVYLINSGRVKCVKGSDEGKELIIDIASQHDFLGYLTILGSGIYDETAIVLEDAELISVSKDDFLNLIFSDVEIANLLIKTFAKNVKEKEDKLLIMAYGNLRKRVAKTLVELDEKFKNVETGNTLEIKREELASYIGIATESLIRTLSDFKSEKLIDIRDSRIRVINRDKLKNLLF